MQGHLDGATAPCIFIPVRSSKLAPLPEIKKPPPEVEAMLLIVEVTGQNSNLFWADLKHLMVFGV
jgi:hypothetical protein